MSDVTIQEMHRVLEMQKALNISEGAPDIKLRKDRLDRVIAMVNKSVSYTHLTLPTILRV